MGLPMVVVPYPHAAGHQRANAASLVEAGAARLIADEDFDAAALLDAAGAARGPADARHDVGRRPRRSADPGRPPRSPSWSWPRRHASRFPEPAEIERLARGGER